RAAAQGGGKLDAALPLGHRIRFRAAARFRLRRRACLDRLAGGGDRRCAACFQPRGRGRATARRRGPDGTARRARPLCAARHGDRFASRRLRHRHHRILLADRQSDRLTRRPAADGFPLSCHSPARPYIVRRKDSCPMNDDKQPGDPEGNGPNPWIKSLMVLGGIFLALVLLVSMFGNAGQPAGTEMGYSTFRENVEAGLVKNVTISPEQITGTLDNGETFSTVPVTNDTRLTELLDANGVEYTGTAPERMNILLAVLIQSLPFILILGIAFFALRQVQKGGGGGAMGFGKSKAKMLTERQGKVTFDDVAGIDEAREELEEIVEFLKDPQRFSKLGGQIPKGALLVGSPGTGKTLLARAIAGEARVPFFTISGSDFVEMFVGVGASRVRDMFEQAKKNAPCIVFIDEIDAVGRHRGHGLGNSNDEREQTLNQLLVEMDGFEANEGIIII